METAELIEIIKRRGVRVSLKGDKVCYEAAKEPDVETRAIVTELMKRKPEVRALLADDPVLTPEQWAGDFARFVIETHRQAHNLDIGWLRSNRPELYTAMKAKENELDSLQDARLSELMTLLKEWRRLLLTAEFEHRSAARKL